MNLLLFLSLCIILEINSLQIENKTSIEGNSNNTNNGQKNSAAAAAKEKLQKLITGFQISSKIFIFLRDLTPVESSDNENGRDKGIKNRSTNKVTTLADDDLHLELLENQLYLSPGCKCSSSLDICNYKCCFTDLQCEREISQKSGEKWLARLYGTKRNNTGLEDYYFLNSNLKSFSNIQQRIIESNRKIKWMCENPELFSNVKFPYFSILCVFYDNSIVVGNFYPTITKGRSSNNDMNFGLQLSKSKWPCFNSNKITKDCIFMTGRFTKYEDKNSNKTGAAKKLYYKKIQKSFYSKQIMTQKNEESKSELIYMKEGCLNSNGSIDREGLNLYLPCKFAINTMNLEKEKKNCSELRDAIDGLALNFIERQINRQLIRFFENSSKIDFVDRDKSLFLANNVENGGGDLEICTNITREIKILIGHRNSKLYLKLIFTKSYINVKRETEFLFPIVTNWVKFNERRLGSEKLFWVNFMDEENSSPGSFWWIKLYKSFQIKGDLPKFVLFSTLFILIVLIFKWLFVDNVKYDTNPYFISCIKN